MAGNGQSATARHSMECHGVRRCAMACCETMCDDYTLGELVASQNILRVSRQVGLLILRKGRSSGQPTLNMGTMECHIVPRGMHWGFLWNCYMELQLRVMGRGTKW